jgi:antitoxin component of MazEF toxin-antitoxin module
MKTRVQGRSNSLARSVSKSSAARSNAAEDPAANVSVVESETTIEPFPERTYMLEDLLAGITKRNVRAETDTGGPVGKEIF